MTFHNCSHLLAVVLSIICPGMGQLLLGKIKKGLSFLGITALFVSAYFLVIRKPIHAFFTLSSFGNVYDSRHILLVGIISLCVVTIYLLFHISNVVQIVTLLKGTENKRRVAIRFKPYFYISGSVFLVFLVIFVPFLFGIALAFTNYNLYHSPPRSHFEWVGLANFTKLFRTSSPWWSQFKAVFLWNITYAVLGSFISFSVGLLLSLVLNNPRIRGRRFFRTVLFLPWAIPSTISIMVFSGLFNTNFGAVNQILESIGFHAIPWFQNKFFARVAVILVHVWISTPFNIAMASAALKSIPNQLYEAAKLDGASRLQAFFKITCPLLMKILAPILILMIAGNFNNFGIIYLLTNGGPAISGSRGIGGTDILMTWIYNLGFSQLQWAMASALTVIVFAFVVVFSLINLKLSGATRQINEGR